MYEPTVIQPTIPRKPEPEDTASQHVSVLSDQVAKRPEVLPLQPIATTAKTAPIPTPITVETPVKVVTSDQPKAPTAIPLSQLKEELIKQHQQQDSKNKTITSSASNGSLEVGLVTLQFIALTIIAVGFFPALLWQNTFLQILGVLFIGIGIFIAIWAVMTFKQKIRVRPSPSDTSFLVTGGPFAFVRHPMYVSLILVSVGLTIAFPTIPRILALIVLIFVLHVKMNYEERMLAARFSGYEKYRKYTGKLIPKFIKG